ncbi:MAG: LLM class flavin-dependent oxidoreductase [Pseudomonadales bacterium]|nr:LLM class flavin-dependent oxidoreductase [Pseudomonadales bacterium]
MTYPMPAVSIAAVPGRRRVVLDFAKEIEKAGYSGLYLPSMSDSLSLCTAIAMETKSITIGTGITPIYGRTPADLAQTAAFIKEISGDRFQFGVGVSHAPALAAQGLKGGKPLADMRQFVKDYKTAPRVGEVPPIILAAMRKKMIGLASEIGEGMIIANGARSYIQESLTELTKEQRSNKEFFIGDMIPTCISDDEEAAKAVNRKTLIMYTMLPNYRNYWKAAGFEQEMSDIEKVVTEGDIKRIPEVMSDRWLEQVTLFGSPTKVRDGIEAWFDAGVKTPIIVPSSAAGNQLKALEELLALYQ